jgi:hypothetical protein
MSIDQDSREFSGSTPNPQRPQSGGSGNFHAGEIRLSGDLCEVHIPGVHLKTEIAQEFGEI